MIVEDDRLNRKLYSVILRSQGYNPVEIIDEGAALRAAIRIRPVVIVMDIRLPRTDGRDIIRALRLDQQTRAFPIMAVSAVPEPDMQETCLAAGADCFFAKPVPLTIFAKAISQLAGMDAADL